MCIVLVQTELKHSFIMKQNDLNKILILSRSGIPLILLKCLN